MTDHHKRFRMLYCQRMRRLGSKFIFFIFKKKKGSKFSQNQIHADEAGFGIKEMFSKQNMFIVKLGKKQMLIGLTFRIQI